MKKIAINESLRDYIQRLNHTYYSTVETMVNILSLNIDLDEKLYQSYERELKESYCAYQSAISFISKSINNAFSSATNWNLNFLTAELEIKEI